MIDRSGQTATVVLYSVDDVILQLISGKVRRADMPRMVRAVGAAVLAHPRPCTLLTIVDGPRTPVVDPCPPPEEPGLDTAEWDERVVASAGVVEGSSLGAAARRALWSTYNRLRPGRFPSQVFADLDDASSWLRTHPACRGELTIPLDLAARARSLVAGNLAAFGAPGPGPGVALPVGARGPLSDGERAQT